MEDEIPGSKVLKEIEAEYNELMSRSEDIINFILNDYTARPEPTERLINELLFEISYPRIKSLIDKDYFGILRGSLIQCLVSKLEFTEFLEFVVKCKHRNLWEAWDAEVLEAVS
jgi:hypothetical protein